MNPAEKLALNLTESLKSAHEGIDGSAAGPLKYCYGCNTDKPEEEFREFTKSYVTVSGEVRNYVLRRGKCKKCINEYCKNYYRMKDFNYVF